MNSSVEIYNDDLRCGTLIMSESFGREHYSLIELIGRYREQFKEISTLIERRVQKKAGRPVDEYMLTHSQVVLLISLMRNNDRTMEIMKSVLKTGDIIAAFEALRGFDTDGIDVKFVYAAIDPRGRVKIGISNDPEKRVKSLNIGNADELTLIYTKRADLPGYQSEVQIHKECSQYRIRGEWFEKEAVEVLG